MTTPVLEAQAGTSAPELTFHATRCAICGTEDNARELYPANFDLTAFNPAIFSARRLPDRIHYRMVQCNTCGLVRSDPVADSAILRELYTQSTFDYGEEVTSLQRTYGRYLAKLDRYGVHKGALLEIGCGNGFFLEEALRRGYKVVHGVEPSTEAVAKAAPSVRPHIVCDIMRPGLFEPEQFDVVCLFQVFDHIPDPDALLDECLHVLKPGGLLLCLNHNVASISARLLKERSPIIDLEHTYLYSPTTITRLVTAHGFETKHVGAVFNN
ncbi:MAG: class I SAM-dependent methyltransferase, partial [Armatimonadota bacterium]|nr:class I SAM-dependent methyltransferase [Armatimonadota bacterium]